MEYTQKQREQISETAKGKTIQSMEWEEDGKYWVITFTTNEEICIQLMAEITMAETQNNR